MAPSFQLVPLFSDVRVIILTRAPNSELRLEIWWNCRYIRRVLEDDAPLELHHGQVVRDNEHQTLNTSHSTLNPQSQTIHPEP